TPAITRAPPADRESTTTLRDLRVPSPPNPLSLPWERGSICSPLPRTGRGAGGEGTSPPGRTSCCTGQRPSNPLCPRPPPPPTPPSLRGGRGGICSPPRRKGGGGGGGGTSPPGRTSCCTGERRANLCCPGRRPADTLTGRRCAAARPTRSPPTEVSRWR